MSSDRSRRQAPTRDACPRTARRPERATHGAIRPTAIWPTAIWPTAIRPTAGRAGVHHTAGRAGGLHDTCTQERR